MVFESFKEHPYLRVTPKEIKEKLNINLRELYFNVVYLEEKGLIELQKPPEGDLFVGARITVKGIDLLESEFEFDIAFPAGDEVTHNDNVFKALRLLCDAIEADEIIDEYKKELLIEHINQIKYELTKSTPSYSRVKTCIDKIKERDRTVGAKVIDILKDPTVRKILSCAARREIEEIQ